MDLEITPIQATHTAPLGPFGGSSLRLRSHMLYIIGKLCPVLRKPPPWFKGCGFGSRLGFFCRAAHQAVVDDCGFYFDNAAADNG